MEKIIISKDVALEELVKRKMLSEKAAVILRRWGGCETIADVCGKTEAELRVIRNMGSSTLREILEMLQTNGYTVKSA